MKHDIFDHDTFPPQFKVDLEAAVSVVLIRTPYATTFGLGRFREQFAACVRRNVRVCIFFLEPNNWQARHSGILPADEAASLRQLEHTFNEWARLGVHVNLRRDIHEKVLVIDDDIAYCGSANFLSYRKTSERTTRWIGRERVDEMTARHSLDMCTACIKDSAYESFTQSHWSVKNNIATIGKI